MNVEITIAMIYVFALTQSPYIDEEGRYCLPTMNIYLN